MIVWYRTNEDFIGQIASIARQQTAAEAQAWLDSQADDLGLAFVVLDERMLDPVLLAELVIEPEQYLIMDGTLTKAGQSVDLGYVPGTAESGYAALSANPQVVAFFDMTDEELGGYVITTFEFSAQQAAAWVLVRNVLRDLARAAGLARR